MLVIVTLQKNRIITFVARKLQMEQAMDIIGVVGVRTIMLTLKIN
jgi:hypothetical protein